MEKQEEQELDLSNFILVFEHPHLAWFGEVQTSDSTDHRVLETQLRQGHLKLTRVCALQSVDMMVPSPSGRPQTARNTSLAPLHSFMHDMSVTVGSKTFTWVKDMHKEDQNELRRLFYAHESMMQKRRVAKLGLVT